MSDGSVLLAVAGPVCRAKNAFLRTSVTIIHLRSVVWEGKTYATVQRAWDAINLEHEFCLFNGTCLYAFSLDYVP